MELLTRAGRRIFADFLMRDRLATYQLLVHRVLDHGYRFLSLADFWRLQESGDFRSDRKYVVLRHDVDSDPATARRLWALERTCGVRSSYYFRLSTVDISLMQDIQASGSEASYHYEELATLAKQMGFTRREQMDAVMHSGQELFST